MGIFDKLLGGKKKVGESGISKIGEKKTTVRTNLQSYNMDMSRLGELIDEFKRFGPYLFFYGFRDEDTALAVMKELPYCTIDLPYIDCNFGTKAVIIPIEEPNGHRFYAVVTGGKLKPEEATQTFTICERHEPIKDRRIIVGYDPTK